MTRMNNFKSSLGNTPHQTTTHTTLYLITASCRNTCINSLECKLTRRTAIILLYDGWAVLYIPWWILIFSILWTILKFMPCSNILLYDMMDELCFTFHDEYLSFLFYELFWNLCRTVIFSYMIWWMSCALHSMMNTYLSYSMNYFKIYAVQ